MFIHLHHIKSINTARMIIIISCICDKCFGFVVSMDLWWKHNMVCTASAQQIYHVCVLLSITQRHRMITRNKIDKPLTFVIGSLRTPFSLPQIKSNHKATFAFTKNIELCDSSSLMLLTFPINSMFSKMPEIEILRKWMCIIDATSQITLISFKYICASQEIQAQNSISDRHDKCRIPSQSSSVLRIRT